MRWALMSENYSEILIIGAGMAGLTCGLVLSNNGHDVRVLDKGRGPGGRMAARRTEISGQTVSFDHGAQYFTARDSGFQQAVAKWEAAGVVARWNAAGEGAWVGTPGMNGPIRAMAQNVAVEWGVRAETIARDSGHWSIKAGERHYTARTLLIAVPAEQARDLLAAQSPDLAAIPASVQSEPCWAVMAAFDAPLDIAKNALRDLDAAISWAARNSAKPSRDGEECWVLHASPARSREVIDLPKEEVAELLLADFFAQTGATPAKPIHIAAHRWLYAMPSAVEGEAARFDSETSIGIAGDYLHSPRVEGAWISGWTLAQKVLNAA